MNMLQNNQKFRKKASLLLSIIITVSMLSSNVNAGATSTESTGAIEATSESYEEPTDSYEESSESENVESQDISEPSDESSSSVNESSDEEEPGAETEEATEEETAIVYDQQPETMEEVQAAIDAYLAELTQAYEDGDEESAALIMKPHWQYRIDVEIMPAGYECIEVTDDDEFGAVYYTFNAIMQVNTYALSDVWDGTIATSFAGGSGTQSDPYQITTGAQLAYLAQQVNSGAIDGNGTSYSEAYYRLDADIDLAGSTYNWTPIGIGGGIAGGTNNTLAEETAIGSDRTTYAFKGVFDGNGMTITGLTKFATRPTANGNGGNVARGFFGAIESAEIKNLTIDSATVSETGGATGILVGFAVNDVSSTGRDISITNCSVTNSALTATRTTYQQLGIGALVGYMVIEDAGANVTIEGCTVSGTTVTSSGTAFSGGVAAAIGYVRSIGTSTSGTAIGGKLLIKNCEIVSTTVNSVSSNSGGMVGYVYVRYNTGLTLEMNNVTTTDLTINRTTSSLNNFGGLVGYFYSLNSGENKFVAEGINLTNTKISSTYASNQRTGGVIGLWHSASSSSDVCDISYITLSGMTVTMTGGTSGYIGGIIGRCYYEGSSDSSCSISNVISSDLTFSTTATTSGHIGGVIGQCYYDQAGNNSCSISNIESSNLTFSTAATTSGNIGGVIGQWSSSRTAATYSDDGNSLAISNAAIDTLSISVTSYSYSLGGIAGDFYNNYSGKNAGSITNCSVNNATINSTATGSHSKGGIIGNVEAVCSKNCSFMIDSCDTDCEIISNGTDGYYCGGIAGRFNIYGTSAITTDNFAGSITNCTSKGEIQGNNTGNYYYGGIAGFLILGTFSNGSNILVENCSATGNVISQSYYVGGLIGYIENTSDSGTRGTPTQTIVRNCYAAGTVNAGSGDGSGTNAGGLLGHIHAGTNLPSTTILVENCYATGDVFITSTNAATAYNVGGFVGRPTKNITIRECYSTGDVYCAGIHVGGFAGYIEGEWSASADNHVTIENSYSTGNVIGGYYNVGGFAGNMLWGYLKNCYSIGSIYGTSTGGCYIGGFVGWVQTYGGQITNCYSTGYVASASSTAQIGGFIGRIETLGHAQTGLVITDCFFDSTTSGMSTSFGYTGTTTYLTVIYNGVQASSNQVTAISTTEMISESTFSAWNITDNVYAPSTKKSQTPDSPWYIDDEVTYPYLYYQADGYNTTAVSGKSNSEADYLDRGSTGDGYLVNILVTPYQTNYNMSVLYNSTTANDWSSAAIVAAKRADYTTDTLLGTTVQYKATTAGAYRAYFPYIYGTTYATYNNKEYLWLFGANGDPSSVLIPTSTTYTHADNTLYSLGAVSRTNIVAFENGPYADKTSDREAWVDGDPSTYTYVGDEVVYTIEVTNYSTQAAWTNVVVTDPLAEGVTLVDGSVGIKWRILDGTELYTSRVSIAYYDGSGTPPGTPYYTYTEGTGEYAGRYILTIYLGTLNAAYYSGNILEYSQCYIDFTVLVGQEAVTDFLTTSPTTWSGDNIRNIGTVSGTMYSLEHNINSNVELTIDDGNTDPVYGAYLLEFYKVDSDTQKGLAGAEFSLYKYTGSGAPPNTVIDTQSSLTDWELCTITSKSTDTSLTSDANGLVSRFQIVDYPGYYMLVENNTLLGYWTSESQWLIEVNGDGTDITVQTITADNADRITEFTPVYEDDNSTIAYYTVENIPNTGSITIIKENDTGDEKLEGAEFLLEMWVGDESTGSYVKLKWDEDSQTWNQSEDITSSGVTGTGGELLLENLLQGMYRITEVVPAVGSDQTAYSLLKEAIEVNIPYPVTYSAADANAAQNASYYTEHIDGSVTYYYLDLTFTISDAVIVSLPITGNTFMWQRVCLIGAVLVLASIGLLYVRKRKNPHSL